LARLCTKTGKNPCAAGWSSAKYRSAIAVGMLILLGAAAGPANSANEEQGAIEDRSGDATRSVDRIFSDPLGGVVVNRTVTVLGKDFYKYFATRWRQSDQSSRYSISIYERPSARFGSEIWVLYRQQRMFHTFLPPARDATRAISEVAVQQVLENITRRELERMTTRNPD